MGGAQGAEEAVVAQAPVAAEPRIPTNLEGKNWCGETPLILAANECDAARVAELIEAGANVHAKSPTGRTAVIAAAESASTAGGVKCLTLLLAARAGIEAKNGNGDNALLRAAATGHLECAVFLIESKADVEVKDCAGLTPLMLATQREHKDFVEKIYMLLTPMVITLQVSPEDIQNGLAPLSFTDMAGGEVAALTADLGQPVAVLRAALRKQIVGQSIQIILPDGRFLPASEDDALLGDVIGDVSSGPVNDEMLI